MAKAKKSKLQVVHEILPKEIFEKVLKNLGLESIILAKCTCRYWRKFIEDFNLVKAASSKLTLEKAKPPLKLGLGLA